MNKKTLCVAILALAVLGGSAFGQQKKEITLTLQESIAQALKNNLNVAVEVISPELAGASLAEAKQMYLPTFALNYTGTRYEQPSTWSLQNVGTYIQKGLNSEFSVDQRIPGGGSFSASMTYVRSKTNQLFQNYNPSYTGNLSFSFTQPLLRNFGWNVSRQQIIIAQNQLDVSRSQFKTTLTNTVYAVEEAYWNLVYAKENLKALQQSLDLSRDLLVKTKKEVEVGQKAPIEVLTTESTVARREADILQAQAQVKRNRDQLAVLLNLDADPATKGLDIVPAEQPSLNPFQISPEEAIAKALAQRPELESSKYMLETKKIDFTVAKNRLLPQLDLRLMKGSPGVSGDRLLYLNNDPFSGVVVGTIPGSMTQAFKDSFKFLYDNWTAGVILTIPVGDVFGRANYNYAKLDLAQAEAKIKNQEQQITLEVNDAILVLETAAKSAQAYKIARELAEKQLEAEMKKLNVGLSTNYFVLQYQNDLASAHSLELLALVQYNIALANIAKVTGTTIEARNIALTDFIK
jgi:outer membrane protein